MRTIEEIQAEMTQVQGQQAALSELDASSQVGFFRALKNMWAQLVQIVEANWDNLQVEVNTLLESKRIGSTKWYADLAKQFQLGDSVVVQNGVVKYETIDPAKQIIVAASCLEDPSGRVLLKVIKANQMDLTTGEKAAFVDYINDVKFAGVMVTVISLRADQIQLTATVKYDRQVLAANGSLLTDATVFPVVDALRAYLANLPFDSVISWTGITDYMQKVSGVLDFVITATEIAPYSTNFWQAWTREIVSGAGHCTLGGVGNLTYV